MAVRLDPASDSVYFLSGGGEMAARIRAHAWSNTPFGPPDEWPQPLRSALSICLNSRFPTAIYWGDDLRLLYNDAWSPIPGPRHPSALGQPAREVWSDIWDIIEPQFLHVIESGDGVFVEDQMLPMARYGTPEETYWSYSFTAIRGERGEIVGIFNSGMETTRAVLSQRRLKLLLDLGDCLRGDLDVRTALREAVRLLGEAHGVDRAGLYEIQDETGSAAVTEEWLAPGSRTLGSSARLGDFGSTSLEQTKAGRVIRLNDTNGDDPLIDESGRAAFERIQVRSALRVPHVHDGKLEAVMFLHSSQARTWTDFEVATVQQVLARVWSWIERRKAAEREKLLSREIDHRAKNALAVVRSILNLTHASNLHEYRKKVEARIGALANAHDHLAKQQWMAVDLYSLVAKELAVFTELPSEIVEGPPVKVPASMVQALTLLTHELATNSAKHGGLSDDAGRLSVAWTEGPKDTITLTWEDVLSHGEERREPIQAGFGSVLIATVVREQLAGSIEVEERGKTRITRLTFPLTTNDLGRLAIEPRATGNPRGVASTVGHVLILEDEAIVRMDLEATVQELGYGLFGSFGAVADAYDALENGVPDLALLDVNVRGTSSTELAEHLIGQGVPVVFLTGYSLSHDMPRAARQLTKPVSRETIASVLADVLAPK